LIGRRTRLYTALALVAFAANSLLCRLALSSGVIDPTGFTTVRLVAGAGTLVLLARAGGGSWPVGAISWTSAALLFAYALPFSFAYTGLSAGSGALLLFGAVQATMILAAFRASERPRPGQWLGLTSAFGGLAYLVWPGVTAPAPDRAGLMLLAGVAWGLYTLRGRGVVDPLRRTAGNFVYAVPLVLAACLLARATLHFEPRGVLLGVLSGALASGVGYVLWYQALAGLSKLSAAIVQLAVPILAAAGGILFLGEHATLRLLLASLLVLGGVGLGVVADASNRPPRA